ncbi:hypothetical protein E2C01_025872 [Portunus trituberculatus]|uniref:Uncharacterized protein n=1 Tax=Portunus trituberculatus TaxID=210409 RepID=A0A5B7EH53_PORTR|nr:hypothetical protein [Portunus trituberculatus]
MLSSFDHSHLDARRTINITDIVTNAARNKKRKSSVRGNTRACTDATNSSRNNEHRRELPKPTSCSSWYCKARYKRDTKLIIIVTIKTSNSNTIHEIPRILPHQDKHEEDKATADVSLLVSEGRGGHLTFLVMDVDFSCGGMAMLEKGTSMEYLMECSSCTTTLLTFLKDSFLRCVDPKADRTWRVLNRRGCSVEGCSSGAAAQRTTKLMCGSKDSGGGGTREGRDGESGEWSRRMWILTAPHTTFLPPSQPLQHHRETRRLQHVSPAAQHYIKIGGGSIYHLATYSIAILFTNSDSMTTSKHLLMTADTSFH